MAEMTERIRKPLYSAAKPEAAAQSYEHNPVPVIEAMYRRVWETSMHDMPFVNNALAVEAVGFTRHEGDWVGAVITPWSINLFLLPGGGSLWVDAASGDRVKVAFPVGTLEFIADYDPGGDIPAYQYCTLFAPVSQFTVHEAAVGAAEAALEALFTAAPSPEDEAPLAMQNSVPNTSPAEIPDQSVEPISTRRAFFKGLVGRRS